MEREILEKVKRLVKKGMRLEGKRVAVGTGRE